MHVAAMCRLLAFASVILVISVYRIAYSFVLLVVDLPTSYMIKTKHCMFLGAGDGIMT